MKKLLCAMLSVTLALGLSLPAAAAQTSADQALAQVTAQVKQTLGIGDDYDTFYGELSDNGSTSYWSLSWSSEDRSLLVEADQSGKVMGYYLNTGGGTSASPGGLPTFPATSRTQAQALAQAFLDKVLDPALEKAQFDAERGTSTADDQYRFSGQILLHSLPSPITFSLTVRSSDGVVLRFYRDDLYSSLAGGVPSPRPAADQAAAAQALKGTLDLRLEYVSDGEGGAVLRYLPKGGDDYYVDAQTGELVNLTDRYNAYQEDNSLENGAAGDAATGGDGGLSQAEQEGIAKLEGVQSKQALDQKVRSLQALGLEDFSLTSFRYWVDRETDQVFGVLSYEDKETGRYRSATVDARTGALESLSGHTAYDEDRAAQLTPEEAQENAEAFLGELWGEQFALTACYSTREQLPSGYYYFIFAQQANGYFFPENYITVSVDVTDGTICGVVRSFEAQVTFDDPAGIMDQQAALDAWFATYTTQLGYLAVPTGEGTLSLALAYCLDREENWTGLDAKTGQPVSNRAQAPVITYDDLEGSWAQAQVEALAEYGIGYYGGSFQPDKQLTQLDLVALLASTQGYRYLPGEEDGADNLYRYAYDMGLLTAVQRDDDALMTRGDTVKLLLDSAGYGEVAALEGIFRCAYADEADIPASYYGYAALAQGMGIVGGDGAGCFAAQRVATRLEAAVMLYNFMNR